MAGTLTRYEGWFLIPFAALYFLFAAKRNRLLAVLLFGAIASLGPLAWLAHNRWYYSDWLSFYRGPYSAKAIQGSYSYPGQGDWKTALLYFGWAARWCAGAPLAVIGAIGVLAALARRSVLARVAAESARHFLRLEHTFFRHADFRAQSLALVLQHALRAGPLATGGLWRGGAGEPEKRVGAGPNRADRDRSPGCGIRARTTGSPGKNRRSTPPPAANGRKKPLRFCAPITAPETASSLLSATLPAFSARLAYRLRKLSPATTGPGGRPPSCGPT